MHGQVSSRIAPTYTFMPKSYNLNSFITCFYFQRYPPDADDCNVMLFYPDWSGSNEGCANDGLEPYYMLGNFAYFFSNTREECCQKFYNWNYDSCAGVKPAATGDYYPDWSGSTTSTCLNDNKMPTYMRSKESKPWYLSTTLKSCCERFFSWDKVKCMNSEVAGTNKYYVKYDAGTCVQDTDGSAKEWDELFDTKNECCQKKNVVHEGTLLKH